MFLLASEGSETALLINIGVLDTAGLSSSVFMPFIELG